MIEKLARRALSDIKELVELPDSGIVAGGSIANFIWEYVSGKKAIINDVDIFVYKGESEEEEGIAYYKRMEKVLYENGYGFTNQRLKTKDYYHIKEVSRHGLLNFIYYEGNSSDPKLIIDSFDINCTEIGYSIEEDKFYWNDAFENFIETEKLKFTSLRTPAHSAIRIVKKSEELGIKLENDLELRMCQLMTDKRYVDIQHLSFTDKYKIIFEKYKDVLSKYFNCVEDVPSSSFLSEKIGYQMELFRLSPIRTDSEKDSSDLGFLNKSYSKLKSDNYKKFGFDDNDFENAADFLFYAYNVNDENSKRIWRKLYKIYNRKDYIDCEISDEKLKLFRDILNLNSTVYELQGMKLSEQVKILDNIIKVYGDKMGTSVIRKIKISSMHDVDDNDILLLQLSARKEYAEDRSYRICIPQDIC